MKTKLNSFIGAFALCVVAISCSEKEETTQPTNNSNTTQSGLSFKQDGNLFNCDSATATLYTLGVSPFNRMIDVYGYKNGATAMEMHFQPKTGNVPADKTFNNAWLTYADATDYYDCKSGSLNVTTCDTIGNKIVATFNFIGENMAATSTKNITEGSINITQITKR